MKKQPNQIVVCKLSCVTMPNGDVICLGKKIGNFNNLKDQLELVSDAAGKPITEKDFES